MSKQNLCWSDTLSDQQRLKIIICTRIDACTCLLNTYAVGICIQWVLLVMYTYHNFHLHTGAWRIQPSRWKWPLLPAVWEEIQGDLSCRHNINPPPINCTHSKVYINNYINVWLPPDYRYQWSRNYTVLSRWLVQYIIICMHKPPKQSTMTWSRLTFL